jgi:alpha-L-fucosidase
MPGPDQGPVSHNSPTWRPLLHTGDPQGAYWSPGMVDVPLRGRGAHDWLWRPGRDNTQLTVEQLMQMYDQSVGRNCNFIVGAVVDREGLVPKHDVQRMAQFGQALRQRFSRLLDQTQGCGTALELKLDKPHTVSQVVVQEDITHGERIRAYEIHGRTAADRWTPLARGTAVGHKRIERLDPVEVAALRLEIKECQATPIIRRLTAYA